MSFKQLVMEFPSKTTLSVPVGREGTPVLVNGTASIRVVVVIVEVAGGLCKLARSSKRCGIITQTVRFVLHGADLLLLLHDPGHLQSQHLIEWHR